MKLIFDIFKRRRGLTDKKPLKEREVDTRFDVAMSKWQSKLDEQKSIENKRKAQEQRDFAELCNLMYDYIIYLMETESSFVRLGKSVGGDEDRLLVEINFKKFLAYIRPNDTQGILSRLGMEKVYDLIPHVFLSIKDREFQDARYRDGNTSIPFSDDRNSSFMILSIPFKGK